MPRGKGGRGGGGGHGPSIKNPRVYEALRRKGYSKSKSARISNSGAHGGRGGKHTK